MIVNDLCGVRTKCTKTLYVRDLKIFTPYLILFIELYCMSYKQCFFFVFYTQCYCVYNMN